MMTALCIIAGAAIAVSVGFAILRALHMIYKIDFE